VYTDRVNSQPKLNILMDLYDWNLKQYISADNLIDPIAYKILCYQMCRSLLYLHCKSICHRDIKPDNFLMSKNGRIVLSDFGSAKFIKGN
jgi:glycogen synthase kinase 3 beta